MHRWMQLLAVLCLALGGVACWDDASPPGGCDGGPCGGPIDAGGRSPSPVVLVGPDFVDPTGDIAVDDTAVYWTNRDRGTVMKVALSGGAPETLATGGLTPGAIAVDATSVYWTDHTRGTVMKVGRTGGTPVTLASGQRFPLAIAVDATAVYWVARSSEENDDVGVVRKVGLDGGVPVTLATGTSTESGLTVDGTSVYWTHFSQVLKVGLSGGTPVTLTSGTFNASGIVVDDAWVYWLSNGREAPGGFVQRMPLGGGHNFMTLATQLDGYDRDIVLDGPFVYWTQSSYTANTGAVMRVPRAGGQPEPLAAGLPDAWDLAVGATSVFWRDPRSRQLLRLDK